MSEKETKTKQTKTKPAAKPKPKAIKAIDDILFDVSPEAIQSSNDNDQNDLSLKIIEKVFDTNDIEVKSDYSARQVMTFAKGKLYAKKYKSSLISDLIDNYSIYAVSKDRKSRKEFSDIAKAFNSMQPDEVMPSIKNRLLGKE